LMSSKIVTLGEVKEGISARNINYETAWTVPGILGRRLANEGVRRV
jgi:hypothetical protein